MSSHPSVKCGMANLGNTCFLNSCIQILNQIDAVERMCATPVENPNKDDAIVLNEWLTLRKAMLNPPAEIQAPVINPLNFVRSIHQIAGKKGRDIFTGWAQNDLPEFLVFMMECAHNARCRSMKTNIRGISSNKTDDLALQCYKMLQETYEREYSEFFDIFYGVYVSRLSTPDGTTLHSNKPESYCTLDLPIPANPATGHPLNLFDCFAEFMADELLSGWMNERTQMKEPVRKNIVFWNFPKILIIVLKRYSANGQLKNGAMVQYPLDDLDLSRYVVGYKANSYKYRLFGVANHMGGVSGGHYTAFVRGQDSDDWFLCNDSTVQPANEREVVSAAAYVLFYRKFA